MTILYLLLIFFVGWLLKVLICERPEPAKTIPREKSFSCAMKVGDVECVVHWTETENADPIEPTLEPCIRRWALRLENPSEDLYISLDRELALNGFPAHAVKILPKFPPSEPEPQDPDELELNEVQRKLVMFSDHMKSLDPKLEQEKIGEDSVASLLKDVLGRKVRRIINPSGYRLPPRHRGY